MFNNSVKVFLVLGHTDLRGAFDKLAAVTRRLLGMDPTSGALFLFVNRRGDRLKALWWDRDGYILLYKRKATGRFAIPTQVDPARKCIQMTPTEFANLLAGLPILQEHKPTLYGAWSIDQAKKYIN